FLTTVLGVYYLFVYTIHEKIPFPLDMSVLPTLFVALGILCLLFTIVIVFYSSISVIVLLDPINIKYHDVFYAKPKYIKNKHVASVLNFVIFYCFTPIVYFLTFYFEYPKEIWIGSLFIIPILFAYYSLTPDISIFKDKLSTIISVRFWLVTVTFFYIGFFALLSIYVFVKYMEFGLAIKADSEVLLSLAIFSFLSYLILIPSRHKNSFEVNASKYKSKRIIPLLVSSPAFAVYLFAGIFSLMPQVASKTASMSFSFLNVGGGIERKYYFTPKSRITVPNELIKHCDNYTYCETKKLNVILDLGGSLYVKGDYFGYKDTIVSLPRHKMNSISLGSEKVKLDDKKEK
ncbi:hypothetical protein B9J80_06075, partial [Vibrio sp. V12_P9A6T4]|uniref:hypothetical protein n=1 Tax=Vibrio sp. V12_P9A6T4 TaxID=1938667 RepID=UPI000B9F2284